MANQQLYDKSNSIILNLETLRTTYKNLLIQYQQAVANYVNYLKQDPSSNKVANQYVTVSGQQFLGAVLLAKIIPQHLMNVWHLVLTTLNAVAQHIILLIISNLCVFYALETVIW